jgi:hypothetical protein
MTKFYEVDGLDGDAMSVEEACAHIAGLTVDTPAPDVSYWGNRLAFGGVITDDRAREMTLDEFLDGASEHFVRMYTPIDPIEGGI